MRRARGQRLDHRDLQLCARGLQGELRQPPQDHRGRLHRQHELPPHGEAHSTDTMIVFLNIFIILVHSLQHGQGEQNGLQ